MRPHPLIGEASSSAWRGRLPCTLDGPHALGGETLTHMQRTMHFGPVSVRWPCRARGRVPLAWPHIPAHTKSGTRRNVNHPHLVAVASACLCLSCRCTGRSTHFISFLPARVLIFLLSQAGSTTCCVPFQCNMASGDVHTCLLFTACS